MALNIPPLDLKLKHRLYRPTPGYVPQIYGYGRVSDTKQVAGDSLDDQAERIRRFIELKRGDIDNPFDGAEWAGMHFEPYAQSAFKKSFTRRPAGKKLIQIMNPSDHLVVDKLDRIWRSAEDFHYLMRKFTEHGVRVHFVNFFGASIEMTSVIGQYMLGMMALNAQLESWTISDRISRANKARRSVGLHAATKTPWFCRKVKVGNPPRRKLEYVPERRAIMAEIVDLVHSGLEFSTIADLLEERRCKALGVPFVKSAFTKTPRKWRKELVIRRYWAELAIRDAGEPDPNTIKFLELVADYKEKVGYRPQCGNTIRNLPALRQVV